MPFLAWLAIAALASESDQRFFMAVPYCPAFNSAIVLAITASWSQGNRIQVSWLTSVM